VKLTCCLLVALVTVASAFAQDQSDQPKPKREKPVLTDEQRAEMEQKLDQSWSKLPLESKVHLMHLHRALTQMPPDERKFVHERIERFINMSADERKRLMENAKVWHNLTPEQRQKAREDFRKWRQDHPAQEPPSPPNP